jgi:integrase/recombinase XerD
MNQLPLARDATLIAPRAPPDTTALVRTPLPTDQHPALVYLAQLNPGSRRTMRAALNTIAELLGVAPVSQESATPQHRRREVETLLYCDWASLRYQHTQALRALLAARYKPATANKMLAALRRVLLEARRLGLMTPDDYTQAADIAAIKGTTLPPGRALSLGELTALMTACSADRTPAGPRDAALIALLCRGGLRRSEAVALDLADYLPDSGAITVRSGKGRKDRTTYLDGGAADALADWLAVRGATAGPLLCPVNKGGKITIRRLSDQAVLGALQKRATQAMVKRFSPHDLRRTFISDLLDAGADIATVQRMAGHASPETTSRYDRRGEATKRRAASLLHLAYAARTGGTS